MTPFAAAVVQVEASADQAANLARADELVRAAARAGARLVILPERFAQYGPQSAIVFEAEDGPTATFLSRTALELRIALGGGATLANPGGRGFNAFLLYGPDGARLARYDKIHLFKVELDGLKVDENTSYDRGAAPVVAATPWAQVGISICYALRFPELYRALRAAGAESLIVPSAFTAPTGKAHWEVLLRARAIENQCWVLAANQGGAHGGIAAPSYGHSAIIDPWGEVVASLPHDRPGYALAAIDPAKLDLTRRRIPCHEHRVL